VRSLPFLLLCLALPSFAQEDPAIRFSRQIPKAEYLYVVSDGRGDVFAAGRTRDATFPASRNAAQPRSGGGYDTVVVKLRGSDGETLAATFLGGSGDDLPTALTIDSFGWVYLAGTTTSRNFPTSRNAVQNANRTTAPTGWVAKFNNNLSGIAFSTYLGGSAGTRITGIAPDSSGAAYVTGTTEARDFQVTSGAYKTTGGAGMAFFSRIISSGTSLSASTFLGVGTPIGIVVDTNGNPTIVGNTSATDYPVTGDAIQKALSQQGSTDLFITRMNSSGTGLQYSTYLGGPANDQATDVVADSPGNLFLAGITYSDSFPGSENLDEGGSGFVLKYSSSGVDWFAPFSANGVTTVSSLELRPDGRIFAAGTTAATHLATTPDAYLRCVSPEAGGGLAPFYTRLTADGTVEYATYLHETLGAVRWAATLPDNDVITMNRVLTTLEPAPSILRRYNFGAASANRVGCLVNAASYANSGITPGMAVTLFGSGMGPVEGLVPSIDASGKIPTSLGGVQVLFNGTPAPLLFVRKDQINAMVPFGVNPTSAAQVRVEYFDRSIGPRNFTVKTADPGIFRIGASGFGAIINQDGTVNTPDNPAERGSIITFWATGMGPFESFYEDGSVIGSNLSPLRLPLRVSVSGLDGEVLYAGASPEMVAGITQVNVRVPANARASSRSPISLVVGEISAPNVAYVSVR
jgi:uncharacterized protein (TIGR03437 family)